MLKRLNSYLNEMYPVIPRLVLGFIIFFEIYFILLLNNGIKDFSIGIQEVIGAITIFAFLLFLRIADDFKDYELDCRLFKERPLPSGKVKKKDLIILISIVTTIIFALNIIFMNNIIYFLALYFYGFLMSVWFFNKSKIKPNLMLALITHNPVQMIMNIYIISFTCIKYSLPMLTFVNLLLAFTLYFPAFIWEVSRKIKAPKDENEYVTYSKLFGYAKTVKFVVLIVWIDIITNVLLVYNLNKVSIGLLLISSTWISYKSYQFIKDPTKFKFVDKIVKYSYLVESIMLVSVAGFLIMGQI